MRTFEPPRYFLSVGLALACFGLYVAYLPSELTWANYGGDGGDFLAAILSGGVPHPSGYPAYVLLGRLAQQLPWDTPYARGALLSALCTAAAAGLWSAWLQRFLLPQTRPGMLAGLAGGLAWGVAPLVFSQALIVEVHGLQSLLAVSWLWWIALLGEGRRTWLVHLLALLGGFSLGNHLTILLFVPALAVVFWRSRGREKPLFLVVQGAAFLVGASVYLLLPINARAYPPVNWGNPQTWQGFWWTVSGQPYRGLLFQTPPDSLLSRLSAWAGEWIGQFGLAGLIAGVIGATQPLPGKRGPRLLLLWTFFAYSIFAIGYNTFDSLVYLIPAYLSAAGWLAQGMVVLAGWRWQGVRLGAWIALGLGVFLIGRVPFTVQEVDPRPHTQAARFVERYLQDAPEGALLLAQGDADAFPLWYAHFGLKQRPDVRVIVLPLTQFDWYRETLVHVYPDLVWPDLDDGHGSQWGESVPALNPERRVCRSESSQSLPPEVVYVCR